MLPTPRAIASRVALSFVLLAGSVLPATAETITWSFAGTFPDFAWNWNAPGYSALRGSDFSGTITFDADQTPLESGGLNSMPGHSYYTTEQWVFNLPALDTTWTYTGGWMSVFAADWRDPRSGLGCHNYGQGPECLLMTASDGVASNPASPPPLTWELRAVGFFGFPTDAVPLYPAPGPIDFCVIGCGGAGPLGYGQGEFNLQAVPEPTTLMLLGAGLAVWTRRRRSHKTRT